MFVLKTSMILAVAIVAFTGCGSHKVYKQSTINSKPYHAPKIDARVKQVYLREINTVRSQGRNCGDAGYFSAAPALRWSDVLYRAAYEHSHDMMKNKTFSHRGSHGTFDWTANAQALPGGSSFRERMENNGYTKWKYVAENIAMGSYTAEQVMAGWLSSDKHCANIMNPILTDVGMAEVNTFWTQNFAAHQ
ncbi:MAG: SCP-like extracellular protein [Sulfurovum sp.]|nr:MAG: SCP-like extracellular protein [Sulfurovum sp.]